MSIITSILDFFSPNRHLKDWVPKEQYAVADLGSGPYAERIIALAKKHPKKRFLVVSKDLNLAKIAEKPENVDFVRADAAKAVKLLRPGSVTAFNADYLLNNLSKPEELLSLLGPKLRRAADGRTIGRVYVTQSRGEIHWHKADAWRAGFSTSEAKSVEGMKLTRTYGMNKYITAREHAGQLIGGNVPKGFEKLPKGERKMALSKAHCMRNPPRDLTPMRFSAKLRESTGHKTSGHKRPV